MLDQLKKYRDLLLLLAFFVSGGWFIVKPMAQDFINTTVESELASLEKQIVALTEQIEDAPTAAQLNDLTDLLKQQMALLQFLASGERRTREAPP